MENCLSLKIGACVLKPLLLKKKKKLENESLKMEGLYKREYFAGLWRGGMMLFEFMCYCIDRIVSKIIYWLSLEVNCIKIST